MRAKASMAVYRGVSARAIKAFGDMASELLGTMLLNMRKPETAKFIANVSDASIASSSLPLFRKELSTKSADFLADIQESLNQKPSTRVAKREGKSLARVSLTVFYHESINSTLSDQRAISKRRNFRREA
jgi:acetylglutamate synthase